MGFTVKGYQAAQKARITKKSRPANATAEPTTPAGPKNSNGPKGGSSKSSVPANRTYLKTNNKGRPPKVPKVTKAKLNTTPYYQAGSHIAYPKGNAAISATPGVNNVVNNAGRKQRSARVNYRQLRSK